MSFSTFVTDKSGLLKFYETVIGNNETYAPVEKFGKFDFKRVSNLSECDPESPIAKNHERKTFVLSEIGQGHEIYCQRSAGTDVSETG